MVARINVLYGFVYSSPVYRNVAAKSYDELKGDLSRSYPALSPQLQRIASYALEHPQQMALETVARLARSAGVQPSAMVRFAQSLGYEGFSALQNVFRSRLVERSSRDPASRNYRERIETFRTRHRADGPAAVLEEFVAEGIASLERLNDAVASADLARAVKALAAANSLYVLGHRRSFPVAFYLAYALTQLELRAQLLDTVGGMLNEPAKLIGPKDALIVVSFRNYTPEVLGIAQACHERGVPVIAITDHALSPLARSARVCFQIDQRPNAPFPMLVAPLCLAQSLVVALGEHISK